MFKINFNYLINLMLSPALRKAKQIAWLSVILSHLNTIYIAFLDFTTKKLYDINFTGQVMYLEKKLQDLFNIPGLFISDGVILEQLYLSNISEGNFPIYINNKSENENIFFLYNLIEYTNNPDFIVNIPLSDYELLTTQDLSKMDKIINYYKLVQTNYIIKTYE